MSFRLKQMGLALCLMTSLLIGHASACSCSHQVESKAVEPDCHSHHEAAEKVEAVGDGDACEADCICFVEQPSPYAASKTPCKEFKTNDKLAKSQQVIPDIEFVTVTGDAESSPEFVSNLSYSHTLRSLLRSRAPPRL